VFSAELVTSWWALSVDSVSDYVYTRQLRTRLHIAVLAAHLGAFTFACLLVRFLLTLGRICRLSHEFLSD
jgi:hypothetical protein